MGKGSGPLLLALVIGLSFLPILSPRVMEAAHANMIPLGNHWQIDSPENVTYCSDSVPLVASIFIGNELERGWEQDELLGVSYRLDGSPSVLLNWTKSENLSGVPYHRYFVYNVSGILSGLSVGKHDLLLDMNFSWGGTANSSVAFNIAEITSIHDSLFLDPPSSLLVHTFVTTTVLGAGLLVHFKKRKR